MEVPLLPSFTCLFNYQVADINHSDEEILISASAVLISENHPMKLLNTIMETAALNNFRQIYSQLWPEEHEEC